jgi:F420-0:gamma-glutamyl ligase-like protein
MRVASFPFQTTYSLNGHSFMEQELKRAQAGFRKNDNAFLAVDDVKALQAAADRLSPEINRERLDYWTLILGPKFSHKERKGMNLRRFDGQADSAHKGVQAPPPTMSRSTVLASEAYRTRR